MKTKTLISAVILVIIVCVGFMSCSKKDILSNILETEHQYSDEEILAGVKFIGQGGLDGYDVSSDMSKGGSFDITILHMDFGRRSKGCEKFGICSLYIFGFKVFDYTNKSPNTVYIPLPENADISDIQLLLAEYSEINLQGVPLPIDEDIEVFMEKEEGVVEYFGTVPAQRAVFNQELGQFGGYEISITRP